jgi:hypothetical protein
VSLQPPTTDRKDMAYKEWAVEQCQIFGLRPFCKRQDPPLNPNLVKYWGTTHFGVHSFNQKTSQLAEANKALAAATDKTRKENESADIKDAQIIRAFRRKRIVDLMHADKPTRTKRIGKGGEEIVEIEPEMSVKDQRQLAGLIRDLNGLIRELEPAVAADDTEELEALDEAAEEVELSVEEHRAKIEAFLSGVIPDASIDSAEAQD